MNKITPETKLLIALELVKFLQEKITEAGCSQDSLYMEKEVLILAFHASAGTGYLLNTKA